MLTILTLLLQTGWLGIIITIAVAAVALWIINMILDAVPGISPNVKKIILAVVLFIALLVFLNNLGWI